MKNKLLLAIAAFLFLGAAPCWGAGGAPPVQVSVGGQASGGGTVCAAGFGGNTTANNTIVAICSWTDTTSTITAMNDTCGDTFTQAVGSPFQGTNQTIAVYTARTAGGCASVAMTLSSSTPASNSMLLEYNNMASSNVVDCTATGSGNSINLATGNCITTSAVDTLIAYGFQSNGATYTAGTNYTIEGQNSGTGHSMVTEDQNVLSTGTYTGTATTNTSGQWIIFILALKNANQTVIGGGFGGKAGIGGKAGFGYWQPIWRRREQLQ